MTQIIKNLTKPIPYIGGRGRHIVNIHEALASILYATGHLLPNPRLISGIYVENLLPKGAPDKGFALTLLMNHSECPKAFVAGDDETDEDVSGLGGENISLSAWEGNSEAVLVSTCETSRKSLGSCAKS